VSLVAELKRRNVFRVAAAYAVLSWLVLQVADVLLDALDLPSTYSKLIVVLLVLGFFPAMVFSWVYELTPEGLKRESEVTPEESIKAHTGNKLNVAIVVLLALAVGIFAIDRLVMHRPDAGPTKVAETAAPAQAAPAAVSPEVAEQPAVEPTAGAPRDASVAVLPFTTRSRNEDDQFFSDGVHDDLLTQLAKIGSLRVISRTSVMDYRDTTKRIPEIADELGVATVVEGAVQRSGNTVRITAQLIDADTDEHLWAESYDRELTANNLFAIQTEIATSIAGALQATLSPEEEEALLRRLTDDLEALEAYQRAKWLLETFSVEAFRTAEQELDYAIERDPDFAAAWAMQARAQLAHYWFGAPLKERRSRAREAIDRGRSIRPDLPELDIAEGYYHYWGFRDYERALEVLGPALAAYPNDAELQILVAFIQRRSGHFDKALEFAHRAFDLNPRNPSVLQTLGETYSRLGDYARAEEMADRMDEIMPADTLRHTVRASILASRDADPAAAARLYGRAPDISFAQAISWKLYLDARDYQSALRIADALLLSPRQWGMTPSFARGMTMHLMGDEEAGPVLQKGLEELDEVSAYVAVPAYLLPMRCQTHAALGHVEQVRELCGRALGEIPYDAFDLPVIQTAVAEGYALAGLNDLAFEMLGTMISSPVALTRNDLLLNHRLASLHDDPRWEQLSAEARP
jgi:TolB-like protein